MRTLILNDLLTTIGQRKAALGIVDSPEDTEALRNRGARRTPSKRALLQGADARASRAGVQRVRSYA